jgi:hypothetical protein
MNTVVSGLDMAYVQCKYNARYIFIQERLVHPANYWTASRNFCTWWVFGHVEQVLQEQCCGVAHERYLQRYYVNFTRNHKVRYTRSWRRYPFAWILSTELMGRKTKAEKQILGKQSLQRCVLFRVWGSPKSKIHFRFLLHRFTQSYTWNIHIFTPHSNCTTE